MFCLLSFFVAFTDLLAAASGNVKTAVQYLATDMASLRSKSEAVMSSLNVASSPEPHGCLTHPQGSSPSIDEAHCSSPRLRTAGLVCTVGPVVRGATGGSGVAGTGLSGGSAGIVTGGTGGGSASSSPERCPSPLLRPAGILASAAAAGGSGGGQGAGLAAAKQRRGQGLGTDKGDGLSRAIRSMLLPAREVSRMGWAPLRPTGDDLEPGASDLEVGGWEAGQLLGLWWWSGLDVCKSQGCSCKAHALANGSLRDRKNCRGFDSMPASGKWSV
jgi:hypothetical protein